MSKATDLSRRRLLQCLGLGAVAAVEGPDWLFAADEQESQSRTAQSEPDVEIGITARPTEVPILKRFDHFTGLYLYHCHNLEHEDLDMMRNFLVQA